MDALGEDYNDEDEMYDSDGEPIFKGDMGWRDTEDAGELEVSVGLAPQQIFLLQRSGKTIAGWSGIKQTCLLSSGGVESVMRASSVPQGTLGGCHGE